MTLRVRFLVLTTLAVCAAVACSLNPQPLPPDNPDGATMGIDGSNTFGEAGGTDDAASDSSPAPSSDGSVDASDASSDVTDANEPDGDAAESTDGD